MAFFRKRLRASAPGFNRTVRRKRTGRFSRNRRRSRTTRSGTVRTGYSGANSNISFKRKRFNRRQWKRDLYKSTQFKQTYRSLNGATSAVTVPVTNNALFVLFNGVLGTALSPFWTTLGGAVPVDQGGAVPAFSISSIVLKGGMSKICVTSSNSATGDALKVKVWALWSKSRPDFTNNLPATGTEVPTDWDPTVHPDFHESFVVLFGREVLLIPGSRPAEFSYRYKCRKIDTEEFSVEGGNQLIWGVTLQELGNIDGAPQVVSVKTSHNLAFVGDAAT